jgi:multicomponent Na+:H+ antiporter subunit B
MFSLILRTTTRFLLPLLLLFSVFLLLRGHNDPGGGFVAGLVASAAFALYAIAYDVKSARQMLRFDPKTIIGLGLSLAIGSGLLGLLRGQPFLTGQWVYLDWFGNSTLKIGTPLIFDLGVYLVVLGVMLSIILTLMEE